MNSGTLNSIMNAGIFFAATSVVVLAATLLFNLISRYKVWEEINNGNMAVAFATGGKILGVANIMRFAIASNDNVVTTLVWGGIGAIALLIVYYAFELVTPKLNVDEEITKGNKAVGFISFVFSIAFSYIIGASIS